MHSPQTNKAVLMAGGSGSRLFPVTRGINKHLLPVFDTPLIFFPIKTLQTLGVSEILIITNPQDIEAFKKLLGVGAELGVSISFAIQDKPGGIAQGITIAKDWLKGSPFFLALGDNVFSEIQPPQLSPDVATAFLIPYNGADIARFGVLNPSTGQIEEKPQKPASSLVSVGLYHFPANAPQLVRQSLKASGRGELEISDLLNLYASLGALTFAPQKTTWFDCGTFEAMHDAATYLRNSLHNEK